MLGIKKHCHAGAKSVVNVIQVSFCGFFSIAEACLRFMLSFKHYDSGIYSTDKKYMLLAGQTPVISAVIFRPLWST